MKGCTGGKCSHTPLPCLVKEEWSGYHLFKGKERCLLDAPHLCVELRKGSRATFLGESVLRKLLICKLSFPTTPFELKRVLGVDIARRL